MSQSSPVACPRCDQLGVFSDVLNSACQILHVEHSVPEPSAPLGMLVLNPSLGMQGKWKKVFLSSSSSP